MSASTNLSPAEMEAIARADDEKVGTFILTVPHAEMLQIVTVSTLLDIGMAERLNMEGGPTKRFVMFKPSAFLSRQGVTV